MLVVYQLKQVDKQTQIEAKTNVETLRTNQYIYTRQIKIILFQSDATIEIQLNVPRFTSGKHKVHLPNYLHLSYMKWQT